jgi:CTP synthase
MKVAGFCNVDLECVIQSEDLPSIYEVPVNMQRQGLDAAILRKMGIPVGETPRLGPWNRFLELRNTATDEVHVGLVGKYDLQDAYKSISESLSHAATYHHRKIVLTFVNSELLEQSPETAGHAEAWEMLKAQDGLVICPGFGQRGTEGKMLAARYAREHDVPCFGICLGMQMMVIEFARHVLGLAGACSREAVEASFQGGGADEPDFVIDLMDGQKGVSQKGGTMRLGAYDCQLEPDSRAATIYGQSLVSERHRHRYEFNNRYMAEFESHGMKCSGRNPAAGLVEIVEIPALRWYIGTQFHPEYQSTVLRPHPLFMDFVEHCIASN